IEIETLTASQRMPTGKVRVRYEFKPDEPGKPATPGVGKLFIGGKLVGENRLKHTVAFRFSSYGGMDIGRDNGEVVSTTYKNKAPFPFSGKIEKVVFDVGPR